MNMKPPDTTACEYGPAGFGPFSAVTVFLIVPPLWTSCSRVVP
jgi:hypothetical protein